MPEVPEGVVVGGWSFVVAAYSITAVGLAAYGWRLTSRLRRYRDDRHDDARPDDER